MRLSAELIEKSEQRQNPLGERELVLRGMGVPSIEHLGVTRDAFDALDLTDNRICRLENFPRLNRLCHLLLGGNLVESFDSQNLSNNLPNIKYLALNHNRIASLGELAHLGKAFPKLEYLSLVGNPVIRRQHYRLYTIHKIPSLKILDMIRIRPAEREKAKRLSKSAAGAAMDAEKEEEERTFEPGMGQSSKETFQTSFSKEQKEMIRTLILNAKNATEMEEIEESVRNGIFPSHLVPPPDDDDKKKNNNNEKNNNELKREAENGNGDDRETKRSKTE